MFAGVLRKRLPSLAEITAAAHMMLSCSSADIERPCRYILEVLCQPVADGMSAHAGHTAQASGELGGGAEAVLLAA